MEDYRMKHALARREYDRKKHELQKDNRELRAKQMEARASMPKRSPSIGGGKGSSRSSGNESFDGFFVSAWVAVINSIH